MDPPQKRGKRRREKNPQESHAAEPSEPYNPFYLKPPSPQERTVTMSKLGQNIDQPTMLQNRLPSSIMDPVARRRREKEREEEVEAQMAAEERSSGVTHTYVQSHTHHTESYHFQDPLPGSSLSVTQATQSFEALASAQHVPYELRRQSMQSRRLENEEEEQKAKRKRRDEKGKTLKQPRKQ